MKKLIAVAALAVGLAAASAQNIAPGKYSGTMTYVGGGGKTRTDGVEIKIDKVEGGAVQGTATRLVSGFCRGEVPVEGTIDGDKLTLRTVKGAAEVKEGCGFSWELKVDGQKLEGKSASGTSLQLSK
jgi:hypothetical protein